MYNFFTIAVNQDSRKALSLFFLLGMAIIFRPEGNTPFP
jgi:cbb3-type cytochrome oxidase subunit 3